MKIKLEEFWKVGSRHYLDSVIIRDTDTWDYQQFVYDEKTQRFSKELPWLHKRQSVYA